eukprot:Plantae.Rhodophyta-Purpureofilum_apyrenoidigerum.ctg17368.p1 GENE.Plantae.Rhodophyta-Purpureofilum_apyrenoidigerum.ctg17368~~Plantae.Rhodophyta-Purpureofilum_apyrenoidigerum.ctg17368.p1  ORF type:complete len:174 (-),score=27.50 Plantae.Rhodophyta-Purpureofilum_apyrenoidigerum.ctg17368:22-543(-)
MFGFVPGLAGPRPTATRRASSRYVRAQTAARPVDSSFTLEEEVWETIGRQLKEPNFLAEVAAATKSNSLEYTGMLFQPRAYSKDTPRGVPREFEPFLDDRTYAIIHVTQLMLFQAGCFKPSRLCAIFKVDRQNETPEEKEETENWRAVGRAITVSELAEEDDGEDVDLDTMVI